MCSSGYLTATWFVSADMKKQFVVDPLISKKQQLLLACQLVRQILKIDDVIQSGADDEY